MPQKNIPQAKMRIAKIDLEKDDLLYPAKDDIYNKFKQEVAINPEDVTTIKEINEYVGEDLDIPGSELDDEQEKIGSEDEENNYYSLGGDNHNDLEEDNA